MNPLLELHTRASTLKQNGIMVMSVDYVLQQFDREREYYRLAPRSDSTTSDSQTA